MPHAIHDRPCAACHRLDCTCTVRTPPPDEPRTWQDAIMALPFTGRSPAEIVASGLSPTPWRMTPPESRERALRLIEGCLLTCPPPDVVHALHAALATLKGP